MSLQLTRIDPSETRLIAGLADTIWHAYYIQMISLQQIDYMLDKFYSEDALQRQIEEGQQFYKIDTDAGISGFVSISSKSASEYFIHKFYLLPQHHAKNLGTQVMQLIMELIRTDSGHETEVRLTVNRQNFKAINFYFKNGFTIEKVEDFDIGNGYFMNDFVMLLRLKN